MLIGLTSGLGIAIFIGFDMNTKFNDLAKDYSDLMNDYNDLMNDYSNLTDDYNDLMNDYSSLFADYNSLQDAFEEPLTAPDIPTYFEFKNWLDIDNTNTFDYINETWMCGDFSAMLMTRAKSMNWRVRIAVMEYSHDIDINYGIDTPYGAYGHAFCFIECSDGYIYYIEPQTDAVWYWTSVGYHFEMWEEYDFTNISDTVWGENWLWVNYYNYFG
ncbi:MAG: hypothetical protein HWN79_02540 [Candidatus Lokiarchaeota archaeon]|nr:hypothetical protein [Candidatus Lokiarchaeota archaeon]